MSQYTSLARGADESFESYKQRQRLAAQAARDQRRMAAGGTMTSRQKRRSNPDFKAGTYGENLRAHYDAKGINWSKKPRKNRAKRSGRATNREPIATP